MTRVTGLAPFALALACVMPVVAADFTIPPAPDRHVTDSANALSSNVRTSLEQELQAYEASTGHQIVVWIAQSTGGVPLETWTAETANRWKIGRRSHDDGAILFVFMGDRKVRIEVGYGLEGSLTDADAHRIIAGDVLPGMKAGDPDTAVSSGVAAMLATITPSFKQTAPASTPAPQPLDGKTGALFVAIGLLVAFGIFVLVLQVIESMRYGYLVMREGSKAAQKDMRRWWFWGAGSSFGGFSGGSGGFGGGGFSGGGGSFGGGGASGGW